MDKNLRSLLLMVDRMETGPQIYSLLLKMIWGQCDGIGPARLDWCADRIGISVDDQIEFVDWAVAQGVTSRGSFGRVFLDVFEHVSSRQKEGLEAIISDHQTRYHRQHLSSHLRRSVCGKAMEVEHPLSC